MSYTLHSESGSIYYDGDYIDNIDEARHYARYHAIYVLKKEKIFKVDLGYVESKYEKSYFLGNIREMKK